MRKCPQHRYELSAQVQTFYNGLNYSTRALVNAACGGSITRKTARESNQLFEKLVKNNYQAPSEKSIGMKQGGILALENLSSLEAKFDVPMTKLNQQTLREPTIGEIAYMQAQGSMMANTPF